MPRLLHSRTLAVVAIANLLLVALLAYGGWQRTRPAPLDDFGPAPAFTLTDQRGRAVSADEFRGRIVIVNFIYTTCQDTCPLLSARMRALQDRLRRERLLGDRAQLLSLTVDPTHDTPAVLRAYAERHDADPQAWRFLTGSPDELGEVIVRGFFQGVVAIPATPTTAREGADGDGGDNGAPGLVLHSNRFVLIDDRGHMRVFYDGPALDTDQVVRDMRQLLR